MKRTSPRANSSFPTTEKREYYRMAEEIISILKGENGRAVSTKRIVNKGAALKYCRPLKDSQRIANGHPYWRVLTAMTDPTSHLFNPHIEEIKTDSGLKYRLK